MNFTSLQYFLTANTEKSFSRAAKKLYISQQALSKHIAQMEHECGSSFFERGDELKLTAAGQCMERFAQTVLRSKKEFEAQLASIQGTRRERLTVAFDGDFWPPSYIVEQLEAGRDWDLRLLTVPASHVPSLLAAGEADLWLGRSLCDVERLNIVTMGTYRWVVVVPRRIILELFPDIWPETVEFFQNGINLQRFASAPFLLPSAGSEARRQIDAYLYQKCRFTPHVTLEAEQYEILIRRAWMGDGLTICPEPLIKGLPLAEERKQAHIFPLTDGFLEDELVIASCETVSESPVLTGFVQKTRDILTHMGLTLYETQD